MILPILFEMCIQTGNYAETVMRDCQYGEATQQLVERTGGDSQLLRITFEAVRSGRELTVESKEFAILAFKDGVQMKCLSEVL